MLLNRFKYIITEDPDRSLNENHIFNLFVFLISVLFFAATIINLLTDLEIVGMVSFAGFILIFSIYLISRFYIYNYKVLIIFIIIAFISLNGLFLTNFGYKGPIVYAFLTLGMTILFFLNKRDRIIVTISMLVNLLILAIIEYYYPLFFGHYKNDSARLLDNVITLIFSMATLTFLFYLMLQYIETQKFKAEESDRLKSTFIANMSHEIRTPLNGIVGFSSLLNEKNISNEEKEHFIEIIQSNSNHLASLINDLIDISTLEAKAIDLSYSAINLDSFMEITLKKFKTIISSKQKNIQIYLSIAPSTKKSILFVDKIRLSQVLNNLIINAIDYSESESIHIGYLVSPSEKQIEFFVKDQGIGISKEDQEQIFKPFLKAKKVKYLSMGGTGIGLSIAKNLVELMGGKMSLESAHNQGAQFTFSLPNYRNSIDLPINKLS